MRELFAHLHLGPSVERRGALWVDAAGDQGPFADLRGGEPPRPPFAAISWRADSRDAVHADAGRFLDFATTCSLLADELPS